MCSDPLPLRVLGVRCCTARRRCQQSDSSAVQDLCNARAGIVAADFATPGDDESVPAAQGCWRLQRFWTGDGPRAVQSYAVKSDPVTRRQTGAHDSNGRQAGLRVAWSCRPRRSELERAFPGWRISLRLRFPGGWSGDISPSHPRLMPMRTSNSRHRPGSADERLQVFERAHRWSADCVR